MSFYSFENRPVHPGVTPWKSAGGRSVVGQVSVAWLWGHTRAVILKKVEIACFRMVPLLQPVPLAMWCHCCGGPGVWRWLHEGWWAQGPSGMGGVEGLGECFEVPPPISISSEFPQRSPVGAGSGSAVGTDSSCCGRGLEGEFPHHSRGSQKLFSRKWPRQRVSVAACSGTQIYGSTPDPSSNAAIWAVHIMWD